MKKKALLLSTLILFLLSSCVVTQSIVLDKSSETTSGSAATSMISSDFLNDVLEDLSCWTGSADQSAFMDLAVTSVAKEIANSDFSKYIYINKTDDKSYQIAFGFSDFNELVNQLADQSQSIIKLTKSNDDYTTLSFNLSMGNYDSLTKIIPLLSDPNFEAYGPIYNNPPYDFRTEEDYLFMMEFIFGEEARVIEDSNITILIDTPSPIISTTGTKVSDTSTVFEFRLIDFLLLHEPISFSCTY